MLYHVACPEAFKGSSLDWIFSGWLQSGGTFNSFKILNYNILDGYAYINNCIVISDKSVHCAAKIT
jgi:hypothetical protein